MGLTNELEQLTEELYADHHQVFDGFEVRIDSVDKYNRRLYVKNRRNVMLIDSYANYVTLNNKRVDLNSVVVYVDKNNTFYLPKELRELMLLK